jgi:hypothetical protein
LEEGHESVWCGDSSLMKIGNWKTEFPGESIKEFDFVETDPAKKAVR